MGLMKMKRMRNRSRRIRRLLLPALVVLAAALAWALWPRGTQPLQASLVAAAVPDSSAGYTRADGRAHAVLPGRLWSTRRLPDGVVVLHGQPVDGGWRAFRLPIDFLPPCPAAACAAGRAFVGLGHRPGLPGPFRADRRRRRQARGVRAAGARRGGAGRGAGLALPRLAGRLVGDRGAGRAGRACGPPRATSPWS